MRKPWIREEIDQALGWLARGGVQIGLRFSEEKLALQAAWPEDSPLSEAELRAELETARDEVRRIGERLKALAATLPAPPELQRTGAGEDSFDDVPSVYGQLTGVLDYIAEEAVAEIESVVEGALAVTPESLRAEWVRGQVPGNLGRMLSPAVAEVKGAVR